MNKKKLMDALPGFEILIVIVFFGSFILLMIPKCESTSAELEDKAITQATQAYETKTDSLTTLLLQARKKAKEKEKPTAIKQDQAYTPLYIIINNMNIRKEAKTSSPVVQRLPLHTKVFFLNKVTEFTEKIKLSDQLTTDEPWIKIRTQDGRVGWVYGAGVDYYKRTINLENE